MKTIKNINGYSEFNEAPKNKTISLSIVTAQTLYKNNVSEIMEEQNISLNKFGEDELNTLHLGKMFGLPNKKLSKLILGETLKEIGVNNYQGVNNINYSPENTIPLGGMVA